MLSRFKCTYADIKKAILSMDESILDYEKALCTKKEAGHTCPSDWLIIFRW